MSIPIFTPTAGILRRSAVGLFALLCWLPLVAHAALDPPSLVSPVGGAYVASGTEYTFRWNEDTSATGYEITLRDNDGNIVQGVDDSTIACAESSGICTGTLTLTALSAGIYTWELVSIDAVDPNNNSDSSSETFEVLEPPTVDLVSPVSSQVNISATNSYTFSWTTPALLEHIQHHRLHIRANGTDYLAYSTAITPNCSHSDGTTTCTVTRTLILPLDDIMWSVQITDVVDQPGISSDGTFEVIDPSIPIGQPDLQWPVDTADDVPESACYTFVWYGNVGTGGGVWENAEVAAIGRYKLVVGPNDGTPIIDVTVSAADLGCAQSRTGAGNDDGYICSYTAVNPGLVAGTAYDWTVTPLSIGGENNDKASDTWTFTIAAREAALPTRPVRPVLTAPISGAEATYGGTDPFEFEWRGLANADQYNLFMQDRNGNRFQTWHLAGDGTEGSVDCNTTENVCTISAPNDPQAEGVTRWWVRACNAAGVGPWSTEARFTAKADDPTSVTEPDPTTAPGRPVLTAPENGAVNVTATNPTFTWNKVPTAATYDLYVIHSGGTYTSNAITATTAGCGTSADTSCTVTPSGTAALTLADGSAVRWWVRAKNNVGTGPWSTESRFTVGGPVTPPTTASAAPGRPVLIEPNVNRSITGATAVFKWQHLTGSAGAAAYELYIINPTAKTTGMILPGADPANGLTCTTGANATCTFTVGAGGDSAITSLNASQVRWWVRANNNKGTGPWSTEGRFTATTPP